MSLAKKQHGIALIALLAVIALGASWFLVSRLNADSNLLAAVNRQRNAEVLNKAKRALIGYVAAQAAKKYEDRPGALPCPEAAGYYGDPDYEGQTASSCSLPKVGRFPWRTIGTDKLVDVSGEPLWYVVGPGWAYSGSNPVINSNTSGQLTVDGVMNDAVALIIAPGPAIIVAASAGCSAALQARPTSGTLFASNYLECENATGSTFVTTKTSSATFNDQVVKITAADLLPGIEAAIADRIEREIAPALKTVYNATSWGLSGSDKVYPYPATFANPDTSAFLGSSANTRGLLPFSYSESYPGSGTACTAGGSTPRCNTTLVSWSDPSPSLSYTGGIGVTVSGCSYAGPTGSGTCSGTYVGAPTQMTVSGLQSNGAMSLRQLRSGTTATVIWFDPLASPPFTLSTPTPSVQLNSDGTLTISITVSPPAPAGVVSVWYIIIIPGNATADHTLLDTRAYSSGGASTSWFARNEWHKFTHYAIAPGYASNSTVTPRSCGAADPNGACLSVTNLTPTASQRAILILAGRSINGSARPSSTLADYFEFGNAVASYEKHSVTSAPSVTYADTGSANAYAANVASLSAEQSFYFKAANANTGASTLTTPATGQLSLLNSDGSALSASTISANGVVHVVFNGSQFLISKRPFNDRIAVVDSN